MIQYSFLTEIKKFNIPKSEKVLRRDMARCLKRIGRTRNEYGDVMSYHPQYRRNLHKMLKDVLAQGKWDKVQKSVSKMDFLNSAARSVYPISQSIEKL